MARLPTLLFLSAVFAFEALGYPTGASTGTGTGAPVEVTPPVDVPPPVKIRKCRESVKAFAAFIHVLIRDKVIVPIWTRMTRKEHHDKRE
jgi:hypothetical protein